MLGGSGNAPQSTASRSTVPRGRPVKGAVSTLRVTDSIRPHGLTAVPEESDLEQAPPGRDVAAVDAPLLSEGESLDPFLGWTRGDRRAIAALVTLALLLAGWQLLVASWQPAPVTIHRLAASSNGYRLDINNASWVEWAQLDGIGETLAQAIVADRQANGPFLSIDDIARVKGIGPKKLDAIRRWLVIGAPVDSTASPPATTKGGP